MKLFQSLSRRARMAVAVAAMAVSVAGVGAAVTVAPQAASAAGSYCRSGWAGGSCPIYAGPSSGSYLSEIPNFSYVSMQCWTDTQWFCLNYCSPRWFRVWTVYGTWYMHSSEVYNQTGVPHC